MSKLVVIVDQFNVLIQDNGYCHCCSQNQTWL